MDNRELQQKLKSLIQEIEPSKDWFNTTLAKLEVLSGSTETKSKFFKFTNMTKIFYSKLALFSVVAVVILAGIFSQFLTLSKESTEKITLDSLVSKINEKYGPNSFKVLAQNSSLLVTERIPVNGYVKIIKENYPGSAANRCSTLSNNNASKVITQNFLATNSLYSKIENFDSNNNLIVYSLSMVNKQEHFTYDYKKGNEFVKKTIFSTPVGGNTFGVQDEELDLSYFGPDFNFDDIAVSFYTDEKTNKDFYIMEFSIDFYCSDIEEVSSYIVRKYLNTNTFYAEKEEYYINQITNDNLILTSEFEIFQDSDAKFDDYSFIFEYDLDLPVQEEDFEFPDKTEIRRNLEELNKE